LAGETSDVSRLLSLLNLSDEEKDMRGLSHTPGEIAQHPNTWATTTFLSIQQRQIENRRVPKIDGHWFKEYGLKGAAHYISDRGRYIGLHRPISHVALSAEMVM
jgi:hypothetical protein